MKKERINEHDMTKSMLDTIRGGFKTRLITESDNQNDTISPKAGDVVFNDELKKLQDTVDSDVTITNFKIYPIDNNIIIEGVIQQRESSDSGIHFNMSFKSGEIKTTMTGIDLDDNISEILNKLRGYYKNWREEWAKKLTSDYTPKQY